MMEWTASAIEDLREVAGYILREYPGQRIFGLKGQLGAGKTALVKAFVRELGIDDAVSSPSFSLIQLYMDPDTEFKVFHIDLYRLNIPEEVEEIGLSEYLESGDYCFIEWPEIVENLLKRYHILMIGIDVAEDSSRKIRIFKENQLPVGQHTPGSQEINPN